MDFVSWGGLVMVLAMVVLGWVGNRQFNRTNAYGIQEFSGYLHLVFCRLFEGALKLGAYLALLFGFALGTMGMPAHLKKAKQAQSPNAAATLNVTSHRRKDATRREKPPQMLFLHPSATQQARREAAQAKSSDKQGPSRDPAPR